MTRDAGVVEPERLGVHVQRVLALPALGVELLVEVALGVQQPDPDQRHAEVGRGLQVIAGEHAEAARVLRQRLAEAELGGEVRHRPQRRVGAGAEPGRAGERGVEAALGAGELADDGLVGGERLQPLRRGGAHHVRRVRLLGAPPRPDPLEQLDQRPVPRPVQVGGELGQRRQRLRDGGANLESTYRSHRRARLVTFGRTRSRTDGRRRTRPSEILGREIVQFCTILLVEIRFPRGQAGVRASSVSAGVAPRYTPTDGVGDRLPRVAGGEQLGTASAHPVGEGAVRQHLLDAAGQLVGVARVEQHAGAGVRRSARPVRRCGRRSAAPRRPAPRARRCRTARTATGSPRSRPGGAGRAASRRARTRPGARCRSRPRRRSATAARAGSCRGRRRCTRCPAPATAAGSSPGPGPGTPSRTARDPT